MNFEPINGITLLSVEAVKRHLHSLPTDVSNRIIGGAHRLTQRQRSAVRVLSYFTSAVSSISAISIIVVGSCVQNADTALLVCGLSGSVAGMTQTLMSQFADRMKANNQEDVRAALHDTNIEALDLEFQGIIINEVSAHVAELRTVLAESPV